MTSSRAVRFSTGSLVWITALIVAVYAQSSLIWIDVPFVRQQSPHGCGPACASMVVQYWDKKLGFGSHAGAIELQTTGGTPAREMETLFVRQGFRVFAFQGETADVKHHLTLGRPLVVCLKDGSSLHYVVVAGIDQKQALILVNDPARRKLLKLRQKSFEDAWRGSSNWTLLALPPGDSG